MSNIKYNINNFIGKTVNSNAYEIALYSFNSDGYESHICRYDCDGKIVLKNKIKKTFLKMEILKYGIFIQENY